MRRLLFAALLASLVAVLLLGDSDRSDSTTPRPPTPSATVLPQSSPGPPPTGARTQARRFIAAFLSYETGGGGRAVEAAIHASASRHFAGQLLSPAGRPRHGTFRISELRIDKLPGHPDLVLASGDARRPEGVEPFSILFARRDGRWLAVAPAE